MRHADFIRSLDFYLKEFILEHRFFVVVFFKLTYYKIFIYSYLSVVHVVDVTCI